MNNFRATQRSSRFDKVAVIGAGLFLTMMTFALGPTTGHAKTINDALEAVEAIKRMPDNIQNTIELINFETPDGLYCIHPEHKDSREKHIEALFVQVRIKEDDFRLYFRDIINAIENNSIAESRLVGELPAGADPRNPNYWRYKYMNNMPLLKKAFEKKKEEIMAAATYDCHGSHTANANAGDRTSEESDPLEGIEIYEPTYKSVGKTQIPESVCTQAEYRKIRVEAATQRSNAAFNANEAGGVVFTINAALRSVTSPEGRQILESMKADAEADLRAREREFDDLDNIYERAQAVPVIDCDKKDDRTSYGPRTEQQQLDGLLSMLNGGSPWQGNNNVVGPSYFSTDYDAANAAAQGMYQAQDNMQRAYNQDQHGPYKKEYYENTNANPGTGKDNKSSAMSNLANAINVQGGSEQHAPQINVDQGTALDQNGKPLHLPETTDLDMTTNNNGIRQEPILAPNFNVTWDIPNSLSPTKNAGSNTPTNRYAPTTTPNVNIMWDVPDSLHLDQGNGSNQGTDGGRYGKTHTFQVETGSETGPLQQIAPPETVLQSRQPTPRPGSILPGGTGN